MLCIASVVCIVLSLIHVPTLPFASQSSEQSKTLKLPFPTVILEIVLDFLYTAQARRVEGT